MTHPTFEHEANATFQIKGKGVHVQMWTLLSSSDELGGITIRDHKRRTLARVTEDGFGDRDPKKIRVVVDLSEAFTANLPRATSYHHAGELFEALAPLIATLPKSKWEKKGRYKSTAQKNAERYARAQQKRRHVFDDIFVPAFTPHGGWAAFYTTLPKGHPACHVVWERWKKQDPDGQQAWIAATMPPFWEFLDWKLDVREDASSHEAVLGLSGNYGTADIQRAWRLKAKTAHPDVGGSAEEFRRITEARDVLLRAVGMH